MCEPIHKVRQFLSAAKRQLTADDRSNRRQPGSVLPEQPLDLGLGTAIAIGLDPAAAQTAVKAPLQLLAHFLGAVAFQRQLDQASQRRRPRQPLGLFKGAFAGAGLRGVWRRRLLRRFHVSRIHVFFPIDQRGHIGQRHPDMPNAGVAGSVVKREAPSIA